MSLKSAPWRGEKSASSMRKVRFGGGEKSASAMRKERFFDTKRALLRCEEWASSIVTDTDVTLPSNSPLPFSIFFFTTLISCKKSVQV